jgi:hypothetical protein
MGRMGTTQSLIADVTHGDESLGAVAGQCSGGFTHDNKGYMRRGREADRAQDVTYITAPDIRFQTSVEYILKEPASLLPRTVSK